MSRRGAAAGLALALAGLLALAGCGGGGDQGDEEAGAGAAEESAAAPPEQPGEAGEGSEEARPRADSSLTPLPRRRVEIYFPGADEGGLITESREIFATATPGDQIKQIVADLISGPTRDGATHALPGGTRLRQAYVLDSGVAWLDFSSELTEGLGGGSEVELLTIYAIVNSVVANVPQVKRVGFLINGRPVETLNGHVYLMRPLRPDFRLVRGSITVRHGGAPLAGPARPALVA